MSRPDAARNISTGAGSYALTLVNGRLEIKFIPRRLYGPRELLVVDAADLDEFVAAFRAVVGEGMPQ